MAKSKNFSQILIDYRDEHSMKVEELADLIKVHPMKVVHWETGSDYPFRDEKERVLGILLSNMKTAAKIIKSVNSHDIVKFLEEHGVTRGDMDKLMGRTDLTTNKYASGGDIPQHRWNPIIKLIENADERLEGKNIQKNRMQVVSDIHSEIRKSKLKEYLIEKELGFKLPKDGTSRIGRDKFPVLVGMLKTIQEDPAKYRGKRRYKKRKPHNKKVKTTPTIEKIISDKREEYFGIKGQDNSIFYKGDTAYKKGMFGRYYPTKGVSVHGLEDADKIPLKLTMEKNTFGYKVTFL